MDEKKDYGLYTKSQLNEFRKSIQAMGETVHNGTVEIPLSMSKGRKISDKIKIEEIIKTPYSDVATWRKFSRIYYAHPLYKRLLEYFAYIYFNQYIISPIFTEGKKPNKKKLMNDYNAALRSLDEDITVEKLHKYY